MYICLCKGITDRAVREAAREGCGSLHDLRRELGVASQCARCAREAREILREALPPAEPEPAAHATVSAATPVTVVP